MKHTLTLFFLLTLGQAFAQDMSATEDSNSVYIENSDGMLIYVGGCSLHEDYLDSRFVVKKTLLDYIQGDDFTPDRFLELTKHVDQKLLSQAAADLDLEWSDNVDDLTVEEITYLKSKELKLYRLNIGVGGGNGMFVTYLKNNLSQSFQKVAHTFDGDLIYCDNIVWTK